MRLVIHREIPEDENLRRQWDELVLRMARPEVFYTYEWALAVDRAYRASLPPLLLLAYEDDSLVGVVALATDSRHRRALFLANTTADYCDFVCAPERCLELTGAVLAELRRLNVANLQLANLPADSPTARALGDVAARHHYSVFSRPAYRCAQVLFSAPEHREAILQMVHRNRRFARLLKGMGKTAQVTLSHLKSWERIESALPRFAEAHVARFLAMGRISNLARPERRVFLKELARLLSVPGWITLSHLLVGDQIVAWNYGFQYAGSWFWYQPTFDSRWEPHSPGYVLLWKIVEDACQNPEISLVDLGLGAEGYKEHIANGERQTLYLTVSRSSLVNVKESARYHAATAIKSAPRLEGFVRRVLHSFSSLRGSQTGGPVGLAGRLLQRCGGAFLERREVLFFESPQKQGVAVEQLARHSLLLQPVSLENLAAVAMHTDDPETMAHVLRAAGRLRAKFAQAFALVTSQGVPVHICGVADFHDFYMSELDCKLSVPAPDSVLLFDCFTPGSARGRGYYGMAISAVAAQLRAAGKQPWIFSSVGNVSSLHGIEKAGFVRRFSLTRSRTLFVNRAVRSRSLTAAEPISKVSSVG